MKKVHLPINLFKFKKTILIEFEFQLKLYLNLNNNHDIFIDKALGMIWLHFYKILK